LVVPSIGFLRARHAERRAGGPVLVVADPEPPAVPGRDLPLPRLPGARREANEVAALFPAERVTILTGADASEERLAALAPAAAILHLAAHGLANDKQPLASRLALAASSGADGLWTAREALDLGLRAELVVLSACSGGAGATAGEGALGFGHALLGAGAASVLASLWPVPDEVAAYEVVRFHEELRRGASRAIALRTAALDTRDALAGGCFRTPGGSALAAEPAFWAGFVLLGAP
jgi:CHAT domain-containing protein